MFKEYEDILEFPSRSESSRTVNTLIKPISVATEMSVRLIDVHDSGFPRCKGQWKILGEIEKSLRKARNVTKENVEDKK